MKRLIALLISIVALGALAGCHHFHRRHPAPPGPHCQTEPPQEAGVEEANS